MSAGNRPEHRLRPREGEEVPVSVLSIERRDILLWISSRTIPPDEFPPCIRNILTGGKADKGKNRALAVLAAFLGQAGWCEEESKKVWQDTAERLGLEGDQLFRVWFRKMHCPRCGTIKEESKGYPRLGLGGLGYCRPDDRCSRSSWPAGYAADVSSDQDMIKGRHILVRTANIARVFDWDTGREGVIELSDQEREDLEDLIRIRGDRMVIYTRARVGRKLQPRFFLKESQQPRRMVLSEML